MSEKRLRLLEFLAVGIAMGIAEDLIAVSLVSDASITWRVVGVVFFVALPFAFFSEYIVDHPRFWERLGGIFRKKNKEKVEYEHTNQHKSENE